MLVAPCTRRQDLRRCRRNHTRHGRGIPAFILKVPTIANHLHLVTIYFLLLLNNKHPFIWKRSLYMKENSEWNRIRKKAENIVPTLLKHETGISRLLAYTLVCVCLFVVFSVMLGIST